MLMGIRLVQDHLFAKPRLEAILPNVSCTLYHRSSSRDFGLVCFHRTIGSTSRHSCDVQSLLKAIIPYLTFILFRHILPPRSRESGPWPPKSTSINLPPRSSSNFSRTRKRAALTLSANAGQR